MVISLSGHSSSGKTSLAQRLSQELDWPALSLDSYWLPNAAPLFIQRHGKALRCFDHPALYDGARLAHDAAKHAHAIVEGFAAMHYPAVISITTFHFHLDVPWAVCAARRRDRPDPRPSDASWHAAGMDWHNAIQTLQRQLESAIILPMGTMDEYLFRVMSLITESSVRSTAATG